MPQSAGEFYRFGPFRFDTRDRMLWRGDEPVPLTPKALETLQILLESGGRLVTKDDLMARLWPNTFVEEANLSHQIYKLREALGEQADGGKYVETLARRGYRFVAALERVSEAAQGPLAQPIPQAPVAPPLAEPVPLVAPPPTEIHDTQRRATFRQGAVLVGGLVAIVIVATYLLAMTGAVKRASSTPRSIAVLPFLPLTPADHDEAVELGMANALITRLTNVPELIVRPTSAVVQYQTPSRDPIAAGKEQQVDVILDGKIQRANDRVRVTVQLLQVSDGRPVWADTFDAASTSVFDIQDAISQRVVKALEIQLTEPERVELGKHDTASPEAYDAFLRGYYLNQTFAQGDFDRAADYLRKAVTLDPGYARAWGALAYTYSELAFVELPMNEARDKAREYVRRALEIDPDLPEAHAALSNIHLYYDWDWAAAERDCLKLIALQPGAAWGHQFYAWYLAVMGRYDEGVIEAGKGRRLDPLSGGINTVLVINLTGAGRIDEAMTEAERALELSPHVDPIFMTWPYIARREYEKAIDVASRSSGFEGPKLAYLGFVYGMMGRRADAERVLGKLQQVSVAGHRPYFHIAEVYAGLGDKDQAMAQLEKAYAARSAWLIFLKFERPFEPLRNDPRFIDLLRRLNFPG